MDQLAQLQAFDDDLAALIERYCHEFDIPVASMIGTLHMAAYGLAQEAFLGLMTPEEDDEEPDE